MKLTSEFLNAVWDIAASSPAYREGGTGADGTCDCIGLVMGALGGSFPMHSTNWFFRYAIADAAPAERPRAGMLVFRSRGTSAPGWDLHERYRSGGRYFNGDLADYYHVGVVVSDSPLCILHCTSPDGIRKDASLEGWQVQARIAALTDDSALYTVSAPDGGAVNLRRRPSLHAPLVGQLKSGARVAVTEQADDWCTVETENGLRGYIMARYLTPSSAPAAPDDDPDPGPSLADLQDLLEEVSRKLDLISAELSSAIAYRDE